MTQQIFSSLLTRHTSDQQLAVRLYQELEAAYTDSERHFHNLEHLSQMLAALEPLQAGIDDYDTLLFAVFYHDIVYDVVRTVSENDNEDSSAAVAERVLKEIGYPLEKIERCTRHILATKKHELSTDADTNFLLDTDMMVLGQPWEEYKRYMNNIRKEYEIYPDNIFSAGRTAALKKFLTMSSIFKVAHFQKAFEATAKDNMERELEILSFY